MTRCIHLRLILLFDMGGRIVLSWDRQLGCAILYSTGISVEYRQKKNKARSLQYSLSRCLAFKEAELTIRKGEGNFHSMGIGLQKGSALACPNFSQVTKTSEASDTPKTVEKTSHYQPITYTQDESGARWSISTLSIISCISNSHPILIPSNPTHHTHSIFQSHPSHQKEHHA